MDELSTSATRTIIYSVRDAAGDRSRCGRHEAEGVHGRPAPGHRGVGPKASTRTAHQHPGGTYLRG